MKKSEMYRMAQIAVIRDSVMTPDVKLDIINVLAGDEHLALFIENNEEKKAQGSEATE